MKNNLRDVLDKTYSAIFIISLILVILSMIFLLFRIFIDVMKITFVVSAIISIMFGVIIPCVVEELS